MEDVFITKFFINKVRHLKYIGIKLSQTEKKHLILTGKNGSGKTSLLEEIKSYIKEYEITMNEDNNEKYVTLKVKAEQKTNPSLFIFYNYEENDIKNILSVYIGAKRSLYMEQPMSIEKIIFNKAIDNDLSKDFLKYMIYLDYQILSIEEKDNEHHLIKWFNNFTKALREVYNCPELEMKRISKDLTFKVYMPNYEPFGLNEMSDGYAAFLDVIQELILRMDNGDGIVNYNMPGIVLIDEIEAHLHIELQKKILPFLTTMFPNIQFIVSTHSPFVINSISNAVVFDLEKQRRVEDLSAYSYETIIESYFDINQYSHLMENKFNRYKELYHKERSHEEEKEFFKIRAELGTVSPAQKELYNAFQQMELKLRGKAGS